MGVGQVVCLGSAPSYQHDCVRSPFQGHFECIDWRAYVDTADIISSDPVRRPAPRPLLLTFPYGPSASEPPQLSQPSAPSGKS